ncbi:type II toxin-antitoxin system VapC family toxin [Nitrososphaera viennensis]|uniref:Ribonuclease VapC n=2 Tax=Nitrososphaera viennensis TaxID=1034015 RepID=A0A060HTJ5_9ARCH|nr:type II toxin-antitoxin system VapC family toxin [Nitrososphaera viennensis]AIC16407.1 putative PIN domain nuclease [Nitrososphaera viennensis EN76]UVS68340.1 type II toxin-antitoxin system VapC family toxin [Nitrososphaera viennensis]
MVCLDTDFMVAYLRKDAAARDKLQELESAQEPLHTTVINAFELYKGAFNAKDTRAELARVDALLDAFFILALDRDSARAAGAFHNRSNPVGESDLLIGSIALANKQVLITKNKKHFERIPGLKVEGW